MNVIYPKSNSSDSLINNDNNLYFVKDESKFFLIISSDKYLLI
jgi:hypothetical protein